jgi:hypothetical protein
MKAAGFCPRKNEASGRRRSGEVTPSAEHSTPERRRKQENSLIDEDGDIVLSTFMPQTKEGLSWPTPAERQKSACLHQWNRSRTKYLTCKKCQLFRQYAKRLNTVLNVNTTVDELNFV